MTWKVCLWACVRVPLSFLVPLLDTYAFKHTRMRTSRTRTLTHHEARHDARPERCGSEVDQNLRPSLGQLAFRIAASVCNRFREKRLSSAVKYCKALLFCTLGFIDRVRLRRGLSLILYRRAGSHGGGSLRRICHRPGRDSSVGAWKFVSYT